jgi:hypothetical protein
MARSFFSKTDDFYSFEEFIDEISKIIIFADEDSLLSCVDPLFKISNNSNFFKDYLNNQLSKNLNSFQKGNTYSEQSYMLYDCEYFFVRITYWPKLISNLKVRDSQMSLFSYGMVHDHNFSLLTAGYKGDGYMTRLWEYDYESVIGYKNEEIQINFLEETKLYPGKAIYYRPSKDIHCQYPPEIEDSLAINIVLKSDDKFTKRQYEFDINQKKIKDIIYGTMAPNYSLINLASFINNSKTIDLLLQLATEHKISLIRQKSLETICEIENSHDIWKIGLKDKDKGVSEYSQMKLKMQK